MPIVGSAVATAIFGTVAAGSFAFEVTAALVNLALGVGLQIAGNLLTQKKPEVPGTNLNIQTGGVVSRSVLFGHSVTAGSLVYANVWGKVKKTKNAYVSMVVAVADKRCGTPTNFWVNDTLCAWPDMSGSAPYAQGYPLPEFASKNNNRAWIYWHDGTQTTADSFLTSQFAGDAHYPWSSTAVGNGVAYAVLTFQYDREYFSGSLPSVKFVTPGCYWYDPRKDGSVGGSGLQRWNDESTWATTNNPAVHIYNILRGINYNGSWMYGLQDMVAARLPTDSWFAAMNECDVAIAQADSSTLPQYQAGGEVPVSTKPADALNALLTACAGRLSEVAGVYKLHVGAPGTAVLSFGDADIISSESQTYHPFPSISETINAITGKYPEPDSAWASTDSPPLYNTDYETADGDRELPQEVSYDFVPYKEQVQRLMKSALAEARRFRQVTYVLPAWARALEPGDFVSVTDTRNGFSSKLFRADDLKYMSSLDVQATLTEVDASDYDWTAADDYKPVTPSTPILVLPEPQPITGWNAAPTVVKDADGNDRRPGILVTFDGDLDDVQSVRIQVRLAGATTLQFDGTAPYGDLTDDGGTKSVTISFASILPNTAYEVRGILVPYSGREALWSNETESGGVITEGAWLGITTDDIRFGPKDFYPFDTDAFGDEVKDLIQSFASDARSTVDALLEQANLIANHLSERYQVEQSIRTELSVAIGDVTAGYTQAITAAVGPDSAIVAQITQLQATVDNDIATAVNTLTAQIDVIDGEVTANTDAITAVTATVGGVSADGTFRIQSVASPGDGWSRIAAQARASTADGWATASWFLDAKSDGTSRFGVVADQFIVTDGTDTGSPLAFVDGVLTLQVANIGTVTAGIIKSPDDLFVITVADGKLEWFEAV